MAAQTGRNLLVKIGSGTAAVTVASMRTTSFTVNGELVDVTNKDSAGMRELLGSGGVSSLSVAAQGLMAGGTQDLLFINRTLNKSIDAYTLVYDDSGTISGSFQCESFAAAGEYNGAQTYDLSLQSSGTLSVA